MQILQTLFSTLKQENEDLYQLLLSTSLCFKFKNKENVQVNIIIFCIKCKKSFLKLIYIPQLRADTSNTETAIT